MRVLVNFETQKVIETDLLGDILRLQAQGFTEVGEGNLYINPQYRYNLPAPIEVDGKQQSTEQI